MADVAARHQGAAAVRLHDLDKGADDLEPVVRDLSFVGALVNGFTYLGADTARCLDHPRLEPLWAHVEQLAVPV